MHLGLVHLFPLNWHVCFMLFQWEFQYFLNIFCLIKHAKVILGWLCQTWFVVIQRRGCCVMNSLHQGANNFFSTQFKQWVAWHQTQICTVKMIKSVTRQVSVAAVVVVYRQIQRRLRSRFVFDVDVKMGTYCVFGCWFDDNPCMLSSRGVLNCDLFYSLIIH